MAKATPKNPPKKTPGANDKSPDLQEGAKPGDELPAPDAPAAGADNDPPADPPAAPSAPANKGGKPEPGGYVCLEPIKHKGKRHQIGDPIELTKAEADTLIEQQAVKPA